MRPPPTPGPSSPAWRPAAASLAALVLAAGSLTGLGGCPDDEAPGAPDAAPGPDANDVCLGCTADQICVQVLDGTCGQLRLACEARHPACAEGTACTAGCMQWQCNDGGDPPFLRCDVGGCPGEVPGALRCYGP